MTMDPAKWLLANLVSSTTQRGAHAHRKKNGCMMTSLMKRLRERFSNKNVQESEICGGRSIRRQ